jgi:hypothetical protein
VPQEQSKKNEDPPIGQCAECGEPVTAADPGKLRFSLTSGSMTHVHDRCAEGGASPSSSDE